MNFTNNTQSDPEPINTHHVWNWVDVLLITISSGLIVLLCISGFNLVISDASPISDGQEQPSLIFNAAIAALEAVALLGSIYIFGLRRRNYGWGAVGLQNTTSTWWWYAVMIAMIFIPLMGLISLLIQTVLGRPVQNPQLEFLLPENYSWPGAVAMLVLGGIAVPIAEEIFFRGVLYQWLRDRWGMWIGILISSVLFGALHGEISVAGATFVMGLALAWIYERSQSLWPAILIHVLNNSLKLLALYVLIATGLEIPGI